MDARIISTDFGESKTFLGVLLSSQLIFSLYWSPPASLKVLGKYISKKGLQNGRENWTAIWNSVCAIFFRLKAKEGRPCLIASCFLKQFHSSFICDYPRLHISVYSGERGGGGILKHFRYSLMEHFSLTWLIWTTPSLHFLSWRKCHGSENQCDDLKAMEMIKVKTSS